MHITQETIKELSHNLAEPEWLLQKRLGLFSDSLPSQLGNQNYGKGLYTKYAPELFADGDFSVSGGQVSCEGSKVYHFDSAVKDKNMAKVLKKEMFAQKATLQKSNFACITGSIFTDGFVVNCTKSNDSYSELIISSTEPFAVTYVMVVVAVGVSIKMHEQIHVPKTHSVIIEYVLQESSALNVVASGVYTQEQSLFVTRVATVYTKGKFEFTDAVVSSTTVQSYATVHLCEPEARGFIASAVSTKERGLYDGIGNVVHEAPHTNSHMFARSVLADVSKVVHRGYITIQNKAEDSHSYQKHEGLLLSEGVEFNAVPNLDIQTHSVTCSHGVSATRFSDLTAFYCTSKGLTYNEALQLYKEGYFEEALIYIASPEIKQEVLQTLLEQQLLEEIL